MTLSGDLEDIFRSGKGGSVTNDNPEDGTGEGTGAATVEDLMTTPFGDMVDESGNVVEDAPEDQAQPQEQSWLDSLLGAPEPAQEPRQQLPRDNTPPAQNQPRLDPAFVQHVQSGGDPAEFYRQQFAREQAQSPAQPPAQPTEPQVDPDVAALQTAQQEHARKVRENYKALVHADRMGDEAAAEQLLNEQVALNAEAGRLANRAAFVNERLQQGQRQTVSREYQGEFADMLRRNHGVTDERRLEAASGRVLEVDWLRALMDNEQTFPLVQNPLVRGIMVKAALYDLQYNSKRQPARAASDPAPSTASPAPTRQAEPARANVVGMQDKDFTNFMTKGNKK